MSKRSEDAARAWLSKVMPETTENFLDRRADPGQRHAGWVRDAPSYALAPAQVTAPHDPESRWPAPIRVAMQGRVRGFLGRGGVRYRCQVDGCGRFMERGECQLHGRVRLQGCEVLHLKTVLDLAKLEAIEPASCAGMPMWTGDDETGNPVAVWWPEAIVSLTGYTLERAMADSRAAMDADASREVLEPLALKAAWFHAEGWLVAVDGGWALVVERLITEG